MLFSHGYADDVQMMYSKPLCDKGEERLWLLVSSSSVFHPLLLKVLLVASQTCAAMEALK